MITRSHFCNPIIVLLACLAMFVCGCTGGDDAPNTASVSGKVTIDGKSASGVSLSVMFTPPTGSPGQPTIVPVKPDGTYEGEAIPGENVVSIILGGGEGESGASGGHAAPGETTGELYDKEGNPTGKKSPVGAVFMGENSPLIANVKAEGENKFDFEVGTKASGE